MNDTLTSEETGYLSLLEAAAAIGIHPQSLRRLVKSGIGPPVRMFAGKLLFERAALHQFKANYDPKPGRKPTGRLI